MQDKEKQNKQKIYEEYFNETIINKLANNNIRVETLFKRLDDTIIPFYYQKFNPPRLKPIHKHKIGIRKKGIAGRQPRDIILTNESKEQVQSIVKYYHAAKGVAGGLNLTLLFLVTDMRELGLSFDEIIEYMHDSLADFTQTQNIKEENEVIL